MFTDEATIEVIGGNGGRGCVSFRHEKYVPKGGPDGGNGGKGGDVYFIADENTDTLSMYATTKHFDAPKGRFGMGENRAGKSGDDLYLHVPPGTIIRNAETNDILADLTANGDQVLIARGGRGGYGNAHFKSSTRQKPDFAELGEPGEKYMLHLELKLVADVGIVGFPSVGKSTLISVISSAKPKIADYHFTTIVPNLGVVTVHDRTFVVCDVPGLIEGASEGKGLGDQFLKHIERCGILLHVLDVTRDNLAEDYRALRKELTNYSPTLAEKKEIVILNKTDISDDISHDIIDELQSEKIDVKLAVSAATHKNIQELLNLLLPMVLEEREKRHKEEAEVHEEIPVLQPHLDSKEMGAYRIKMKDDAFHVYGTRIEQFTKMTEFNSSGAQMRFRDVLSRIGLKKALKREGANDESNVFIGEIDVSDQWL